MTQMRPGHQRCSCQCLKHRGVQPDVLVRFNGCNDIHVTPDLLTPSTAISTLIPTSHTLNFYGLTIEGG